MGLRPSTVSSLTPAEFARRLGQLFPPGWTSEEAKTPGGVFNAVMQTLGSQLSFELGTPLTQMITLGGVLTPGDTITVVFAGNNFQGTRTLTTQVVLGETFEDVARSLALAIASDPILNHLSLRATAHGSVIVIRYPNVAPAIPWTTAPPPANSFIILVTTNPGATETVALAPGNTEPTGSLQYAWAAVRAQTAEGDALDLAAEDFLGNTVLRVSGEPDASYRQRLLAVLANLGQGATRQAVSNAISAITGIVPRIVEPWSPADTGVIDGLPGAGMMFFDIDTVRTPARLTDPGLAYQGFIESILPGIPVLAGNPLPCMDDGIYTDIAGCSMFDFDRSVPLGAQLVYDVINAKKVYGTVAWVRFESLEQVGALVLSGGFAQGLVGSITTQVTCSILGQASAARAGTVIANFSGQVSLSGMASAARAGTIAPRGDVSISLGGVSSAARTGSLFPIIGDTTRMSGVASAAQAGTIVAIYDSSISLMGRAAAAQAGVFVVSVSRSAALTGQASATHTGTFVLQVSPSLQGLAGAGTNGALGPSVSSRYLSGVATLGMGAIGELI